MTGSVSTCRPTPWPARYRHLARCDPETDIVVAERDGEVVGYARTTWDDTAEGHRDHWLVVEADPAVDGPGGSGCSTGPRTGRSPWRPSRSRRRRASSPARCRGARATRMLAERGFIPHPLRPPHDPSAPRRRPGGGAAATASRSGRSPTTTCGRSSTPTTSRSVITGATSSRPRRTSCAFAEERGGGTGTSLWQVAWAATRSSARCARTPTTATASCSGAAGRGRRTSRRRGRGASGGSRPAVVSGEPAPARRAGLRGGGARRRHGEPVGRAGACTESLGYEVVATDVFLQRPIGR